MGRGWGEPGQGRPWVSVFKPEWVLGNSTGRSLTHSGRFSLDAASPLLIPALVVCPQAGQGEETEV